MIRFRYDVQRMMLIIALLFPFFVWGQNMNGNPALIVDASQLSSPFTEKNEGSDLGALIDGDTNTYWHSRYSTSDNSAVHWLDVEFQQPVKGYLTLYVYRRVQAANDHPTLFEISSSIDAKTWTVVDTVAIPYTGKNGVMSESFCLPNEVSHLRLTVLDCYPNYRKFWHASEVQLYHVGYTDALNAKTDGLRINEIQVANIDQFIDPSYNYGSWVEIYNADTVAVSLHDVVLRHTDADGFVETYKIGVEHGQILPNGFKVLWFDHHASEGEFGATAYLNIPYKLDTDGGTLELIGRDSAVVDVVNYAPALARCSYARLEDGGEVWGLSSTPTLCATNAYAKFAVQRLAPPVVSQVSTVFQTPLSFTVEIPEGAVLRYTTDGSTPTLTHGATSVDGHFEVTETTVYRFALVGDDRLPSQVVTRSFIKDTSNSYYLPILSLSTHPDNLFSDEIGVYVKGTNGVSGNGQSTPCNWNMDWERPVNMEYLVPQGDTYQTGLNQECEFKISGGFSRAYGGDDEWAMKSSFSLKATKLYEDNNAFDYPIFEKTKPYNKYKVFKARNGGNDTYARITDAAIHEIFRSSGFKVNVQACQPAHVFINGKYLGMLNLRESNNKYFAESEHGIDTDDVDQFELNWNKGYEQKEGEKASFMEWLARTKALAQDPTNESKWNAVCEVVDVDDFCNYMAAEIYMGGGDWLTNNNNIKGFASRAPQGKYHMVIFDLDSAFGTTNMLQAVYDLLSKSDGRYADNGGVNYLAEIFFNMLKYEPFKQQFIDAYCIVAGSVLNPERCKAIIDAMTNYITPALQLEGTSPQSKAQQLYNNIANADKRNSRIQSVQSFFKLPKALNVKMQANHQEARLLIGGQEVPTRQFDGALFAPAVITAQAPLGYTFEGWYLKNHATSTTTSLIPFQSHWSYYDQGSLDGSGWQTPQYDATSWRYAAAPFGYGTVGTSADAADYHTTLDYGANSSNKRPTYYFRHVFNLAEPPVSDAVYKLTFYVDDGVVFHVNGVEVGAYNCVRGATYKTYAQSYSGNTAFMSELEIPVSVLRQGQNVIAAEVHNSSGTSSDIFFDVQLTQSTMDATASRVLLSASETIRLDEYVQEGTCEVEAVFRQDTDPTVLLQKGATPVRINEVSAANEVYINEYFKKRDWVELYNATDHDIDLEGMYLSNDRRNPQKYRITGDEGMSTIIPAHGFRLVWCDAMKPARQLHAPFTLDNANGAYLILQAADGTWADEITYLEQDRWQTYGRYPDGGALETLFDQASIACPNLMSTYYFEENPTIPDSALCTQTLALQKGWNWISHTLQDDVHRSRMTPHAHALRSQTATAINDSSKGWTGQPEALQPAEGYKLQMKQAADVVLRGTPFDPQTTVALQAGWNWKGFPLMRATTLDVALAHYEASEGDVVVGKEGFSIYGPQGWTGTLTTLTPGRAYGFYAMKQTAFTWNDVTPAVLTRRSLRYTPPQLSFSSLGQTVAVDLHAHPNVACVVAALSSQTLPPNSSNALLLAYSGDECRGVAEVQDGKYFLNVNGQGGELIRFILLNNMGEEIQISETLVFSDLHVTGTLDAPFMLSAVATGISNPLTTFSKPRYTEYYNLNGQKLQSPPEQGVYIQREVDEHGNVRTQKLLR
ncbi:MAG: CotH kinase family protein [Bacteroidaceae bacterium]|nr:CotH kinase family protein [Bacteroidaceae bacterium]